MQRYCDPSQTHWQHCDEFSFGVGLRQRRGGAVGTVLVHRLMRFQNEYGARNALHYACCVISCCTRRVRFICSGLSNSATARCVCVCVSLAICSCTINN
jgi:hypothetical protein